MTVAKSSGRLIGALMLVQLVTGLILPYVLLHPIAAAGRGFIDIAAGMAGTIRLSVLMLFVGGAVSLAIAAAVRAAVPGRRDGLGLWLLVLAAMNFTLQLIENGHWLTLLWISQAHQAGGTDPATFAAIGAAAHASFRWPHYTHILIVVGWLFTLFWLFFRAALIPRPLAAFGMVTGVSHFVGITLPAFGGYQMPYPDLFGAPLTLAILGAALWLITKGLGGEARGENRREVAG